MAITFKGKSCLLATKRCMMNNLILQVFKIAYCQHFRLHSQEEVQQTCKELVSAVKQHTPELLKKVKIHLLLHLGDCITDFGPTSAFNTERYILKYTQVYYLYTCSPTCMSDVRHSILLSVQETSMQIASHQVETLPKDFLALNIYVSYVPEVNSQMIQQGVY